MCKFTWANIKLFFFNVRFYIHTNQRPEKMAQLKEEIRQSHELGDEYYVNVDKYIPVKDFIGNMDVSSYKIVKRVDSDVYDVHFYKNNKYKLSRKGIIKSNALHVARESNKRQLSLYNIYLVFTLFRR